MLDPLDPKATSLKGRGKRVTLRDKSEKVLADFIIGNEIKDRPGQRVRPRAGPEADLRRQGQGRPLDPVRRLDRDEPAEARRQPHPLGQVRQPQGRPEQRRIIPRRGADDRAEGFGRALDARQRTMPAGKELNTEKISALTSALADLKIVGVRPKPEG